MSAQLKVLVIDDEKRSRHYIASLVKELEPFALVIEAANAHAALRFLDEMQPDIVFLDIQMPQMDGFTFLKFVEERHFKLVFVTAYSQYAIKAIKEGASDYILKPIKKSEFKATLARLTAHSSQKAAIEEAADETDPYLKNKLTLTYQQGVKFATLKNIIYFKADNTYTTLYMANGEKIVTTKPIHRFEKTLDARWFFRIHKSYIINLHHFREYVSRDGNVVVMTNGDKLIVSRYKLKPFLAAIKAIPAQ